MSDLRLRELERRYRESNLPEDHVAWLQARSRLEHSLTWTQSNGGPLLLLEEAALGSWKGATNPDDPCDPATDYGRACEVEDWIGLLSVGAFKGVVLQEPMPAAFFCSQGDLVVVRTYMPSREQDLVDLARSGLERARVDLGRSEAEHDPFLFELTHDSVLCLFDSCLSGEEALSTPSEFEERLSAAMVLVAAGAYLVSSTWVESFTEDGDEAGLHFLIRQEPRRSGN